MAELILCWIASLIIVRVLWGKPETTADFAGILSYWGIVSLLWIGYGIYI